MSTRDQYSTALPSYRRASDFARSPSYATGALPRRVPISPSPTVASGFGGSISRMDSSQRYSTGGKGPAVPPMDDTQSIGTLQYADGNSPIKATITGVIDKGFFLSEDNEWTCYRRNYFSCNCSYSLSPYYPAAQIQYVASPSATPSQVFGFAMCISAVVSDSDQHTIELVQHTPKRDKGPTTTPTKIPLLAKQDQQSVHAHAGGMFGNPAISHGRAMYSEGYGSSTQPTTNLMAEHTFERIQFKQATQNNGKRRAAQQYYHLVVELWADLGGQGSDQYVKVAFRKSAKMIVRGRSPGHYQNERRASQSNPPSGSAGNMGSGYAPVSNYYETSSSVPLSTGPGTYDARGGAFTAPRRHALPAETPMTADEQRSMEDIKGYSYFPGAATDGHTDDRVDAYDHQSHSDSMHPHMLDMHSKVKSEYENTLPRLMHPPVMSSDQRPRCGPFEAKPTSNGYYPPHMMSPSNLSMTMS